MSAIHFEADLDSKKLEDAIRQSNQTIKQWSDGVVKAGGQADAGLNKMTKSFKDAIKEQKELIKSIEKDVKTLQKAYDDATAGKAKQAANSELRSAKKALAEEQGILLGIQKQQIEANDQESSSINNLISGIGKWAMGLVSVGAALKIAKSIIASTETTTHKFEVIVAQATSGVGYFFKSIASGDWSNFRDGLADAIKGAGEFVDAMQDIRDRTNEQKIKSAEISSEIAELRAGTFDRDIENNDRLITNLKEIIRLQKIDYTNQAKIAADTYKETLKNAALQNNIDADKLDNLISEYTINKSVLELGDKYNEKQAALNKIKSLQPNATIIPELEKEIELMGAAGKAAGEVAKKYGKVPEPLRESLAGLKADQIKLEGLSKIGSKFDERRLATAENIKEKAKEEAKENAIEAAKIENRIKTQEELLNKAIESNNAAEIKAIAARIVELKKELEVRDKIAKQVVIQAEFEGFGPTKLPVGGLKTRSVLPTAKKQTTEKQWEDTQKQMHSLVSVSVNEQKKIDEAKKKADKEELDRLKKQLELREQIVNATAGLVMQIGEQIGLDERTMNILGSSMDAFARLTEGDYIGAATSMLSGIIAMIPNEAQKFAQQIEDINRLIKEQQRLIDISKRKGGEEEALQNALALAESKLVTTEAALEQAEYKLRHSLGGPAYMKRVNNVKDLTIATEEARVALEDAKQALDDFLIGGVTENTIADVIAQGFQEGKTSVDDFANYMNDVLVNAVMDIFKAEILGPSMTEATRFIKDALSDKILSEEEKTNIDRLIKDIATANEGLWENLAGTLNIGDNAAQAGLTGIVRNISEETGSELAGLFRRFADDERAVKDYSRMGVAHLVGIEANTMNTVLELQKANIKLDTVITNTKPAFAAEI
jgi:hypothetical protein